MVFVVSKCHSQWYCFFVQRREKHCTFALFCARYSCFWPQKLAQNPSESAFLGVWNLLFGSWMSPWIWSPGHKSKGGEGSFRSRWMYEFWDDNVCKWGCKYLHPGLQIFASDAPVLVDCALSIWESIRKCPFCRAGMLATDIFSAWDSVFRRLDAPFGCFSASVGCSCSLPWFVLTHSEEMFKWQVVSKRLPKPTKCQM